MLFNSKYEFFIVFYLKKLYNCIAEVVNMAESYKAFVDNLRRITKEKKISQVELADLIGISKSTLGHYFTGNTSPSLEILVKIADALNVSCDELLGRNDVDAVIRQAIQNEDIKHIVLELDKDPKLLEKFKKMFS
jgi:transcriptional regulator with XRE-family HTH domain